MGTDPAIASADAWPSEPTGYAQLGYILLIVTGGLMALAGIVGGLLALTLSDQVIDGAFSLAVTALGSVIVLQGIRAFNATRWRSLSLFPEWVWLSLMVLVWALGTLLFLLLPQAAHRSFPPLIVLGASLASLLYLSATSHGLRFPAGRDRLSGELGPRHIVYLSTALSATLSTIISLILEGVVLVGTMAVLMVATRLLDDQVTFDLLSDAAQDPRALQRLEEMVASSPAALAGLACIVVVVAPAIEEMLKGLPLFFFARRGSGLTERMAILLGVACGAGFAFAENVGYLSMLTDSWWLVFWFRAGAAVMHGTASGYIGRAWYRGIVKGQWGAMFLDLCKGWGVHGFWNALALIVGWFAYRGVNEGVLFCIGVGLVPLAVLFTVMARWGIWVTETS